MGKKESNFNTESEAKSSFDKLVEKAVAGDKTSLNLLCEEIMGDVFYRLKFLLGDKETAEDVSQEVMIKVSSNISKLRDPKAFRGWLASIITNEKNNYLKASLKQAATLDIDDYADLLQEEDEAFLPGAYAENEEMRRIIASVIQELPNRQREAVLFHYYDGLSVTETAKVMEISHPAVSKFLTKANSKIKQRLESLMPESERVLASGLVPMGIIVKDIMDTEKAEAILLNAEFFTQTIVRCSEVISAGHTIAATGTIGATASTANTAANTTGNVSAAGKNVAAIIATCACIIAAATVAVVLYFTAYVPSHETEKPPSADIALTFIGGSTHGAGYAHINPDGVDISGIDKTLLYWWITDEAENVITYGNYTDIQTATAYLSGSGISGEFIMHLQFEAEDFSSVTINENFYITS